jgi:SlyX protein
MIHILCWVRRHKIAIPRKNFSELLPRCSAKITHKIYQQHQAMMNEDRLIEIETRLAFQEDALQTLNQVIYQQQQQIDRLESLGKWLAERLQNHADNAQPKPELEIPPHY